jgi:predicted ArsR family transcriptional regulator
MSSSQRPPKFVDDRLAVALSHETRETALSMCSIRPTSAKEVADALEISVNAAWYHVDKLQKLGCIEEVASVQRRGAQERFYRATCDYYFDAEAWASLSEDRRWAATMKILRLIGADVDKAIRARTAASPDRHLSRTTIDLDDQGRVEAYAVLARALDGLLDVRKNCVARKDATSARTTRTSFVLMQLDLFTTRDA